MLYKIVHKLKWFYKEYRLSHFLPFTVLITYTLIGAALFRHFELEPDEIRRKKYRESTEYAFNQIIKRMTEIQCGKGNGSSYHRHIQTRETKEALFWLIDYLNITTVIEERCDTSPWTWTGSLFYAGQLYTTIGMVRVASGTIARRPSSDHLLHNDRDPHLLDNSQRCGKNLIEDIEEDLQKDEIGQTEAAGQCQKDE
ncbi:unnamed protein product [Bursaphelenchus xylophilus]|uniref:(pine wood nematode) hypothetical protein n=1 Tax=Bursaphelenchus xylophilus TaxID=6326 RepID=A0A1I7RS74_BURXY|nr:unnamed protein product [Bursaphelenchus xylophilus]CAG9123154.1 unnamed protein product [Bursaphelenchus xylophilus]